MVGGFSFTSTSGFTTGGGNFTWSTFGFGGSGGGGGGFLMLSGGGGGSNFTSVSFTFTGALGMNPSIALTIVFIDKINTKNITPIIRARLVFLGFCCLSS